MITALLVLLLLAATPVNLAPVFPTPDSRLPTPDSGFPTPDSRFPTPDSGFPTPASRLPTPDSRFPTPGSNALTRPTPQAPAAAATASTAVLTITPPTYDAQIEVDGTPVAGTGATRTLETPPLASGRTYQYRLVAKWEPNTYTKITRTKTVTVRAGDRLTIDLTVDDPADRVSVLYVPTPDFVVAEMVKLAGITASDVTYEPGVGDARITIAAVRGGARRAVGIDLDPERVEESRANVKAAGLSDRIDIRLGDALEQPDLGQMTVVLLYMGDHFNMLIRPYLWKQLPVGARVVSHRFLMGDDWPPDKTVKVDDEYGLGYDVHLWTITEAHKRLK